MNIEEARRIKQWFLDQFGENTTEFTFVAQLVTAYEQKVDECEDVQARLDDMIEDNQDRSDDYRFEHF